MYIPLNYILASKIISVTTSCLTFNILAILVSCVPFPHTCLSHQQWVKLNGLLDDHDWPWWIFVIIMQCYYYYIIFVIIMLCYIIIFLVPSPTPYHLHPSLTSSLSTSSVDTCSLMLDLRRLTFSRSSCSCCSSWCSCFDDCNTITTIHYTCVFNKRIQN